MKRPLLLLPLVLPILAPPGLAKDPGSARKKNAPARSAPAQDASLAGPALSDASLFGWMVRDAARDSLLEGHNAGRNFTPGSTLKMFTTWLALETLGPDKTFTTGLYRSGRLKDGVLQGDLIIRGGGDPGFVGSHLGPEHGADRIFPAWHAALAREGVKSVTGCVIGDGSYLEEEGPHPASLWEDAGNYYAGNVSGLCYNDNLYVLTFNGANAPGKPVSLLGALPRHAGIQRFDNRLLTGPPGSRDSAYILGGFPSPARLLRGAYPAGRMPFSIKGSLPNPAWTAARELRDYLAFRGIAFASPDGPACGDSLSLPNHPAPSYASAALVASHVSAPVRELVRHTNQKSDNNYAAQLLALSGKASGRGGDFRGGLALMEEYLAKSGFDREQVHFRDGTGLSRYNWVSPAQTVRLLAMAHRHKHHPVWQASLVGGPGSEKKLQRYGSGWTGRLYVKTGTLEGVASLAGYLRADSGRWLAFAVMANNYGSRAGAEGREDPQSAFIPLLRRWARQY